MSRWLKSLSWLLMSALFSADALAAIALAGTRMVFDGRYPEASIEATNRGDTEVLMQAWLTDGAGGDVASSELPFVVSPPLAHLPAQGKQTLRVLYEGLGMPRDRESLLHLYVLGIPRRSEAAQQLTIAVRQRINVFYRPPGLRGHPADAAQTLAWRLTRDANKAVVLQIDNPTAYHVSLHALRLDGVEVSDYQLVAPGASASIPVLQHGAATRLSFKALTDYGGQRSFCADVNRNAPFHARLANDDGHTSIGKC